jgi:hypothetical protein
MTTCGIWLSRNRLVAVVVDDEGRAAPALYASMNDDERWALLDHIDAAHGLDCKLVIPDDLLRSDAISQFALERGHGLWAAPWQLVDAIRRVAGLASGPSGRVAAMIARLAVMPGFRGHLRRVDRPGCEPRQLPLL